MKKEEALRTARKTLFASRKKVNEITINHSAEISRYDGDASMFVSAYDEKLIFSSQYGASESITVFEAWNIIKEFILSEEGIEYLEIK